MYLHLLAYKEEIFGPVVLVNTFEDEEEVMSEANCTNYGLFCKFPPAGPIFDSSPYALV
jgi:hypothetical protein